MASRFETRLRKLEALKGEEVDAILDSLGYKQGQALLVLMMA